MDQLAHWESFYVIVGAAAGVLIGLQFVVMTLFADNPPAGAEAGSAAFAAPTVVHFTTVLMLSGVLTIPWDGFAPVAVLWGLIALAGVIYSIIVARRMGRQAVYRPVLEDWLFHALLPLGSYLALGGSALVAIAHEHASLLVAGLSSLALLAAGIHNAWDAVSYHVSRKAERTPEP